jgi:pimeloyl-ACP methyl ester carboxylesterase
MKTRLLAGLALSGILTSAAAIGAADRMECAQLMTLTLPEVKVTEAVAVPAATSGAVTAPHCRVAGVIGTEIRFSLLLPDTWNRKFVMGGGGGFVGEVENQAMQPAYVATPVVNAGYATVGTDTGHQGTALDASWALNNREREINFGYLGVHRTAEVAKQILRRYYGGNETRSYFFGCSNGGRQGLMEAQRYPDDFDGIVSGAPAADFVGIAAQFIKDTRAQYPDPTDLTPLLPADTMRSVATQVLEKCDGSDGVKDGVVDDPRSCEVDAAKLAGLSDAQQNALKAIYGPTRSGSATIFPAQPFGGEADMLGWPLWISGMPPRPGQPQAGSLRFIFGTQFFKYFVFDDPTWDYTKYDLSTWKADTARAATFLNATNPDLGTFKSQGRKLLLWHGWSDTALSALATIKYYDEVNARDPKADAYVRMFLMPGVLHCAGGSGPDKVDWLAAIDDWVERGSAPDRLVAKKITNGETVRTRPLCRYPQRAVYSGSGSTDAAENFVCRDASSSSSMQRRDPAGRQ